MNFYVIRRKDSNPTTTEMFKNSSQDRGINFIIIETENFDFSKQYELTKDDLIYNISGGSKAKQIEKFLINDRCSSLYLNYKNCINRTSNISNQALIFKKNNLPIINTIFDLSNNIESLQRYVEYLDGFPIIIKAVSGSHGVGVMKIDSFESLFSVTNFLTKKDEQFILRSFVEHQRQGRLIVLGNEVIASHENIATLDFRTNVGRNKERKRRVVTYSNKINNIAVCAVKALGIEFGGVDILFDKNNTPYLSEVNFPCYFPTTQILTGVDISGMILDYLISKKDIKL